MFIDMRNVDESFTMLQLDGIKYRNNHLKLRRPVDYQKYPDVKPTRDIPTLNLEKLGIISTKVEDTPNKLQIGGLP